MNDIGSAITGTDGTFLIRLAGRIDGGVARGAVDGNGDILHCAVVVVAADSRCTVFSANSLYRTTGNGDRCFPLSAPVSASDRSCSVGANSCYIGFIGNINSRVTSYIIIRSPIHIFSGTNAGTALSAKGSDVSAAGNFDASSPVAAAADACATIPGISGHLGIILDEDIRSHTIFTAADPGTGAVRTGSRDLSVAGDGDVGGIAVLATADPS